MCHLCCLPSVLHRPDCKSQRTGCPLGDSPRVVAHLCRLASCLPAPFVSIPCISPVCLAFPPCISSATMTSLKEICRGLPLNPLPENRGRRKGIPHAPVRTPNLTAQEKKVTWGFTRPHFSSFQINAARSSRPDRLKCSSECQQIYFFGVIFSVMNSEAKYWKLFCVLAFSFSLS